MNNFNNQLLHGINQHFEKKRNKQTDALIRENKSLADKLSASQAEVAQLKQELSKVRGIIAKTVGTTLDNQHINEVNTKKLATIDTKKLEEIRQALKKHL